MSAMRVLVLGGTHHVGRAVVEAALTRGDEVTTLTRGVSGPPAAGARAAYADRTDSAAVRTALGDGNWDTVVDTWSGPPYAVRVAARLLADRAEHYVYVSSRSVYRWPLPAGADESAPVVAGHPGSTADADYAAAKRGGELAALETFGKRALLARAGLILGPYERVGRLPWWLRRMQRGGPVPCPGPADRPLQYVDARDLAAWLLDAAAGGVGGAFNAVSRPGHATMGTLLAPVRRVTGCRAELVWVGPESVLAAGVEPWTELPIWTPPDGELAALHDADVTAALAAGLTCRPVEQTVADTWAWLQAEGDPPLPPGRPPPGLDAAKERALLAAAHPGGSAGGRA
jgi:2'-hydroxyisoflavone reductase